MKRLYTIILLFVSIHLYGIEQFPQIQFQSVNKQTTYVNYTPHITEVCATSVYEEHNQNQYGGKPGIRKVNGNDNSSNPYDPFLDPIGDTPWPYMILLIGFYIIMKKWKRMKSSTFNL